MAFSYEKVTTATIQDSINEFCGPYCNPERNQLGFCPTACIPFCYPICNRPFLNAIPPVSPDAIPPVSPDVVIRALDHKPPGVQAGNDYHSVFPLFFLAMLLIGISIFLCYAISKFAKSCSEPRTEAEEEDELESEFENRNGLRESVINSITVFKFKKDEAFTEATKCSVCLDNFQEDETLRLLGECNHTFHAQCIDTWLKSHENCPVCRSDIFSSPPIDNPSLSPEQPNTGGDLEEVSSQKDAEPETGEVEVSQTM